MPLVGNSDALALPFTQSAIAAKGTIVFLKGYGLIKVFKIVAPDGDIEHWVTSDLALGELDRLRLSEHTSIIENYHRGIRQFCGIERSQARLARTQRNHAWLGQSPYLGAHSTAALCTLKESHASSFP